MRGSRVSASCAAAPGDWRWIVAAGRDEFLLHEPIRRARMNGRLTIDPLTRAPVPREDGGRRVMLTRVHAVTQGAAWMLLATSSADQGRILVPARSRSTRPADVSRPPARQFWSVSVHDSGICACSRLAVALPCDKATEGQRLQDIPDH
jgi:hypothetical protein